MSEANAVLTGAAAENRQRCAVLKAE